MFNASLAQAVVPTNPNGLQGVNGTGTIRDVLVAHKATKFSNWKTTKSDVGRKACYFNSGIPGQTHLQFSILSSEAHNPDEGTTPDLNTPVLAREFKQPDGSIKVSYFTAPGAGIENVFEG